MPHGTTSVNLSTRHLFITSVHSAIHMLFDNPRNKLQQQADVASKTSAPLPD